MEDLRSFTINGVACPMVYIPEGFFLMGEGTEYTAEVRFIKGFYIGQFLVTQGLWKELMGEDANSFLFRGDDLPVDSISWDAINCKEGFLDKLNALKEAKNLRKIDGLKFKLPSEAMWEFVARGGESKGPFLYSGSNKLKEVGWYRINSWYTTMPGKLKLPNTLGVYGMSGNIYEWCADTWHKDYYGIPKDGTSWVKGGREPFRVVRGGGWNFPKETCRVLHRSFNNSDSKSFDVSFRLARY